MVYVKWPSKWWLRALRTAHQLGPRGVKGREGEVWHTCHSNGGKQPLPYLSQQLDVSVALKTAAFPAIWANFQLLAVSDLVIEFALRIALAACGALQPLWCTVHAASWAENRCSLAATVGCCQPTRSTTKIRSMRLLCCLRHSLYALLKLCGLPAWRQPLRLCVELQLCPG